MAPNPVQPTTPEQRRREIERRDLRNMALTALRVLACAVLICLAAYAAGFLAFMVFA